MTGAYRFGEALTVIAVRPAGEVNADEAGITLHFLSKQPQLPAPQSSGPSQLAVHMTSQTRACAAGIHRTG